MQKKSIDTPLALLVVLMMVFGMVIISSVSVYPSHKLTSELVQKGLLSEVNNSYFLIKTISHVGMGLLMMVIFSKIPYYLFEKYAKGFYLAAVFALILPLIPGIGREINGAKGWIDIPGLPSIQPVEFAKLGLIVMLAFFLKKRRSLVSHLHMGFIPYFVYVGIILVLLMLQPDFGSILILVPITLAMYFIGGGRAKYL